MGLGIVLHRWSYIGGPAGSVCPLARSVATWMQAQSGQSAGFSPTL